MQHAIHCELVSWDDIFSMTFQLAVQVRQSGYQPDIVIAIARGGYIPARLLCDYLDVYQLSSMRVQHYFAGASMAEQARLTMPIGIDLQQRRVLLVDDVDDTGDTLAMALDHLRLLQVAEVRVAVLHHKTGSSQQPDYYAREQHEWRWLTYPWALHEDISGFVARLQPAPCSLQDMQQRLQQEFDLRVEIELLENICQLNNSLCDLGKA